MRTAFGLLCLALALGACSKPATAVSICGPDCVATMRKLIPANAPSYAPIYGGGWIDSTSTFANGGVITYTVPAKPDDLARFYDGAATQGSLTRTFDTSSWSVPTSPNAPQPPRVLIYAQAGTNRNLYVNIQTAPTGFAKVALVYGAK